MRTRYLSAIVVLIALGSPAFGQKIAFANLEVVIASLPEAQAAGQSLRTVQQDRERELATRRNGLESRYRDYFEAAEAPGATEETLLPLAQELEKLQREIQQQVVEAEEDLARMQADLMAPILEKIESALKEMAEEYGYTYILNSAASGTSIVLHGNEADDVSRLLLSRLGVEIDE